MVLIGVMFVAVFPTFSNTSSAQNVVPTITSVHYGYSGYDGNNVIYMAKTQSNIFQKIPSNYSNIASNSHPWCSANNGKQYLSTKAQTIISPSVSSSDYIQNSSYEYISAIKAIQIKLKILNIGKESGIVCCNGYAFVKSMKDLISTHGLSANPELVSQFCTQYNYGVNLTSNPQSSTCLNIYRQLVQYGASLVPIASVIDSSGTLVSELTNDFGPAKTSSNSANQGNVSQNLALTNGTVSNPNYASQSVSSPYQNNYISVTADRICVPISSFSVNNDAYITVGSQTLISTTCDTSSTCDGASSSINIYLKPAVSICGYVYNGGSQYQNHPVCLIQTYNGVSTGFQLTTNSQGIWHFFAQPGATYMLAGGSTPSWGYSVLNIPISDTSVANEGKSVEIPNGGSHFNIDEVNLQGTVCANGNPVQNAGVEVLINSSIQYTTTNSNGQFNMLVPANSWVNVSISAGSYSYTVQSADVGSGTSFTMTFSYTTKSTSGGGGGGGGGGCVLYGTNITLANGLTTQVQNLYKGEKILSYNTHTHRLFKDKVKQIIITNNVTSVIRIDNFISLSGPNVQPVYVKTAHGRNEWIFLGQITKGMSLYNPQNNTWVRVTSITIVIGHFTVYEVVGSKEFWSQGHRRSDYIANGILVDRKIGYPIGGY